MWFIKCIYLYNPKAPANTYILHVYVFTYIYIYRRLRDSSWFLPWELTAAIYFSAWPCRYEPSLWWCCYVSVSHSAGSVRVRGISTYIYICIYYILYIYICIYICIYRYIYISICQPVYDNSSPQLHYDWLVVWNWRVLSVVETCWNPPAKRDSDFLMDGLAWTSWAGCLPRTGM